MTMVTDPDIKHRAYKYDLTYEVLIKTLYGTEERTRVITT